MEEDFPHAQIFYSLNEAKVIIEGWRLHDNTIRPHSSLAYRPPSPRSPGVAGCATPDQPRRPHLPSRLRPTMN